MLYHWGDDNMFGRVNKLQIAAADRDGVLCGIAGKAKIELSLSGVSAGSESAVRRPSDLTAARHYSSIEQPSCHAYSQAKHDSSQHTAASAAAAARVLVCLDLPFNMLSQGQLPAALVCSPQTGVAFTPWPAVAPTLLCSLPP